MPPPPVPPGYRLCRGGTPHHGHPRGGWGDGGRRCLQPPTWCKPRSHVHAGRFGMTLCPHCLPFPAGVSPRAPRLQAGGDPRATGGHSPAPVLPSPLAMALIPLIKIISSGSHFGEPGLNLFAAGGWAQAGPPPRGKPPVPHHGGVQASPLRFRLPLLTGTAASPAQPRTQLSPINPGCRSGAEPVAAIQGGSSLLACFPHGAPPRAPGAAPHSPRAAARLTCPSHLRIFSPYLQGLSSGQQDYTRPAPGSS